MKKVSVIGLFCVGKEVSDGQSVKTRIVTQELERALGKESVRRIDTYKWKKHPFSLFFRCVKSVFDSENVIFMTDQGGIKVFPRLLSCVSRFGKCRIHYVVIGGWLPYYLQAHTQLRKILGRLSGVYVETAGMMRMLQSQGMSNVMRMPNCKYLPKLSPRDLVYSTQPPYRLCIFSRIMREKGIDNAVDAVLEVNRRLGADVFTLDIYGQVEQGQLDWFANLQKRFSDAVRYRGVVAYEESVATLKHYTALLFPTVYESEGLAGTLIDALASGVPVIASDWRYNSEIIQSGRNGMLHAPGECEQIVDCLLALYADIDGWNERKIACLEDSRQYIPERAISVLLKNLES